MDGWSWFWEGTVAAAMLVLTARELRPPAGDLDPREDDGEEDR